MQQTAFYVTYNNIAFKLKKLVFLTSRLEKSIDKYLHLKLKLNYVLLYRNRGG